MTHGMAFYDFLTGVIPDGQYLVVGQAFVFSNGVKRTWRTFLSLNG